MLQWCTSIFHLHAGFVLVLNWKAYMVGAFPARQCFCYLKVGVPYCGVQVRQAFVRKVLGIVLVQLLVTVGASVSSRPNTPIGTPCSHAGLLHASIEVHFGHPRSALLQAIRSTELQVNEAC